MLLGVILENIKYILSKLTCTIVKAEAYIKKKYIYRKVLVHLWVLKN